MNDRLYSFVGGDVGSWFVTCSTVIAGPPWPQVNSIDIIQGIDLTQDSNPKRLASGHCRSRSLRTEESSLKEAIDLGHATTF